jgi:hypothetical protein
MEKKEFNSGMKSKVSAEIFVPDKEVHLEGAVALELFFQVKDKDGKVTEERTEQGRSFLANFIKQLYCSMMANPEPAFEGGTLQLVDTDGVAWTGTNDALGANYGGLGYYFMRANAGTGFTSHGVLVGTDDGSILPKDINNYALGAQIAHGTGAGQLSYGNSSIVPVTHDGSSYSYAGITRSFSNGSGSGIDVKEIGLAAAFRWESGMDRYFLLARDILGTPITVPNGQALTGSIRIKCYC